MVKVLIELSKITQWVDPTFSTSEILEYIGQEIEKGETSGDLRVVPGIETRWELKQDWEEF